MIKNILFDLDGTLLPMNQDIFVEGYFKLLIKKITPYGINGEELIKAIWHGTGAMINNNGLLTNEEVFWKDLKDNYKDYSLTIEKILNEFYSDDFENGRIFCGYNQEVKEIIDDLSKRGFTLILATNPIFPSVATERRIKWAGLNVDDFVLYTTYENSHYSKPNIKYYEEILNKLNIKANESLMVGNDVNEDMVASELGMDTFLLTDCLINKNNVDINKYHHGSFKNLCDYLNKI